MTIIFLPFSSFTSSFVSSFLTVSDSDFDFVIVSADFTCFGSSVVVFVSSGPFSTLTSSIDFSGDILSVSDIVSFFVSSFISSFVWIYLIILILTPAKCAVVELLLLLTERMHNIHKKFIMEIR